MLSADDHRRGGEILSSAGRPTAINDIRIGVDQTVAFTSLGQHLVTERVNGLDTVAQVRPETGSVRCARQAHRHSDNGDFPSRRCLILQFHPETKNTTRTMKSPLLTLSNRPLAENDQNDSPHLWQTILTIERDKPLNFRRCSLSDFNNSVLIAPLSLLWQQ